MIFVDTNAWFASMVPWDANHAAATAWLSQNRQPLFTTDYVLDETLTLLRIRHEEVLAEQFGGQVFAGRLGALYYLTPADIAEAWQVFTRFNDKNWSFTDCTSKVVMATQNVSTALSFDHHFRQFGSITVVP
jgi:uncharacterized protein